MAGFTLVIPRETERIAEIDSLVRSGIAATSPDDFTARAPQLSAEHGCIRAVMHPGAGVEMNADTLSFGSAFEPTVIAEGANRSTAFGVSVEASVGDEHATIATDSLASRTVWVHHDEHVFMASTSQRMLVYLLGDFAADEVTMSWMLSAGITGFDRSWDRRLRSVPPATRLTLDRTTWEVTEQRTPTPHEPVDISDDEHEVRLETALLETCAGAWASEGTWINTLSGGYDSRAVLLSLIRAGHRPTCISWGTEAAQRIKDSDAAIARRLAEALDVPFLYRSLDFSRERVRDVIGRYLRAGEGRIDALSGYTDGMRVWRDLVELGYEGTIRGDLVGAQGSMWADEHNTMLAPGLILSDLPIEHPARQFGLPEQERPDELARRSEESLSAYCDRLLFTHYAPVRFSALNQVKCAYAEVVSPFLAENVLVALRQLPDHLRAGRALYQQIVTRMSPPIPFASVNAIQPFSEYTELPEFRQELEDELRSEHARQLLGSRGLDLALASLPGPAVKPSAASRAKSAARSFARQTLPAPMRAALRHKGGHGISMPDARRVAFRAYIVSRTTSMLAEDARSGARARAAL